MNAPLRRNSLKPVRKGDVVFIRSALTPELRQRVESALDYIMTVAEGLIALLDGVDPDPDLEAAGDAEPSLGWRGEGRGATSTEPGQDLEDEHDGREPDVDAEDGHDEEPNNCGSIPYFGNFTGPMHAVGPGNDEDREGGDDNGIGDFGGAMEQCGHIHGDCL